MKKVHIIVTIMATFLSASLLYGQNSRSVYLEFLGASNGIGVGYDARFNKDGSFGWGWRTGLGFGYSQTNMMSFDVRNGGFGVTDSGLHIHNYDQSFRLAVPLEINYLFGKRASKFDLGAGAILCADRYTSKTGAKPHNEMGAIPYLSTGYRLVTEKGFVLRAGFLTLYDTGGNNFVFWPHLGFGWAF